MPKVIKAGAASSHARDTVKPVIPPQAPRGGTSRDDMRRDTQRPAVKNDSVQNLLSLSQK